MELKIKLLKILVWPVLLYGCEAWTLRKTDEAKINAAEMWFYRRLLRISYTEKRTNKSILEELNVSNNLVNIIQQRKLGYLGHTIRNSRCVIMKAVSQGKMEGKRKRGRPSTSYYMDNITKLTEATATTVYRLGEDRQKWKEFVREVMSATINTDDADR